MIDYHVHTPFCRHAGGELAEPYPEPRTAALAAERDIPMVTGSDAHTPEHVASGFRELYEILASVPRARLVRYRGRAVSP